ncbi:MAG: hypothetical protein JW840_09165 [Candidatus Thermoplasmatota archaeon]|nr:hypothetical protein [Candidatus Thermoplasmatota archaeon]
MSRIDTNRKAKKLAVSKLESNRYKITSSIENNEISVLSPKGNNFKIRVNGHIRRTWWDIKIEKPRDDLYYILVEMVIKSPRYYIFTSKQLMKKCNDNFKAGVKRRERKGLSGLPTRGEGLNPGDTKGFDVWEILPE